MQIPSAPASKYLLLLNSITAIVYLSWWFIPGHSGNPVLYGLLLFGEIYHVLMSLLFWTTIWPRSSKEAFVPIQHSTSKSVAIFITVAGEPVEIVKETIKAAQQLTYANKTIYVLNDGYVAGKDNWQDIISISQQLGVTCITRQEPGGAKAGNINNALAQTQEPYVAIFDADMVPYSNFLDKTVPYFEDLQIGFVQTPQYYKNATLNTITQGAWDQQSFFFGPIMTAKSSSNAAFICGTNVVIRREALIAVGGMDEKNIAEDFLTSLKIHQKGYHSVYLSEVLSEGLSPEDFLSYYKQQFRWSRGAVEVLFAQNPFFKPGLTWAQKREYFFSALYFFGGIIVLIDICMPLIFLLTGIVPVATTTISFALYFFPFMFLNLYTIYIASGNSITFRAISFSQSSFILQILALKAVLLHEKTAFSVTAKQAIKGNFVKYAYPHILYIFLAIIAALIRLTQDGINPSIITNIAWAMFNGILFLPYIMASLPWQPQKKITSAKLNKAITNHLLL